LANIGGKSMRR